MSEFVVAKLSGRQSPRNAIGLETAIAEVHSVLRNTVVQRRGQQCVLLGARSTGKTLVINKALERFHNEFPSEAIVIKVNGMTHSDDRLALREIAKQLDAALAKHERLSSATGISLENQLFEVEPQIERQSMSQTLKAINDLFALTAQKAMEGTEGEFVRVVFVVEELEKFVAAHQVLVYELFDLSLSSPTGVAVVATSTRMNTLDLFEKRNRSRNFAVNIVLGKPKDLQQLTEIGFEMLKDPDGSDSCLIPSDTLHELCKRVYYTTNSVRHLQSLLIPLALKSKELQSVRVPATSASLLKPIESVPEMDWALLICAARGVVRYETPSVNLVLVMDEWRALVYTMQANRLAELTARTQQSSKPGSTPSALRALRQSWERLRNMGLLVPASAQSTQDDLRMYVPELNLDDIRGLLPKTYTLYGWTRLEV